MSYLLGGIETHIVVSTIPGVDGTRQQILHLIVLTGIYPEFCERHMDGGFPRLMRIEINDGQQVSVLCPNRRLASRRQ